MESREPKRRFPPPWKVEASTDQYRVTDANGVTLACIYSRDDLHASQWGHYQAHLTSDEARRIANAIARLPEFLMPRKGFEPRGQGVHWKPSRPYHVALRDMYVRAHWDEIDALCKLNELPFTATGEKIATPAVWCVYEFERQLDAIQFWNRFNGRWLRGGEFIYPEPPNDLPPLKSLKDWAKFNRGKGGRDPNNGWL